MLAAFAAGAGQIPGLTSVADRLIGTPVEAYPFDWGEGVQMMGLMKAAGAAHDARYADYVEKWARMYEARDIRTLLNIGPSATNPARLGYCGHWSPATAVLYLYRERRKPEHLKLAQDVADFIESGAERSPEGGLGHWQGSHQLWVDTLYMACPLLSAMGQMQNRPEYIKDAANQIVVHARHLQDEKTGLIFHMWDWQTGTHSEGFWGRGDGWVLMSLADTMEVMNQRDPQISGSRSDRAETGQRARSHAGCRRALAHRPRRSQELPRVLGDGDVRIWHAQAGAPARIAAHLQCQGAEGLAVHQR